MRLGNALGGARSPTVPGRASHFVVQALGGKPGHPSSLPHVTRASQSFLRIRKGRRSGLVLDITVLGLVPDPHIGALTELGLSHLPLLAPHWASLRALFVQYRYARRLSKLVHSSQNCRRKARSEVRYHPNSCRKTGSQSAFRRV